MSSSSSSSCSAPCDFDFFISGATGPYKAIINGVYGRTNEVSGGYPSYVRLGDASWCIEHRQGRWQIKHVSFLGTDQCCASVPGGCALEACTSRVWMVWDGQEFYHQRSMKMVTGAEAEPAVSGFCICAPHKP